MAVVTVEAEPASEIAAQPAEGQANAQAPQPVPDSGEAGNAPLAPAATNVAVQQPQAVAVVPTDTPLPLPTNTALPPPTEVPPTPTETVIPTDTPTPTPTVSSLPEGWVFQGVRFTSADSLDMEGLLFFGDLINNTGADQNLTYISTTYYDGGGQKIPYGATIFQLPINTIPQGGQVPFELIAEDLTDVASFDLGVMAEPGSEPPRLDFEFLDVAAAPEGAAYCVTGRIRNPGESLRDYLMIAAVLYDSQNQVINYQTSRQDSFGDLVGEQTKDFRVCANALNQQVVRYELRAWGR